MPLKSRLFTNISHEFRTPLTVITGMADQVQGQPDRWLDKGTEMIKRNGNQLLNLVNQILELQKLESGSLKLNLIHGDLIKYLKYILESFHSLAESKNVQLHFHTEVEELPADYDPEKIIRIVSNLLSNAIKFAPEGGKIDFSVSLVSNNEKPFYLLKVKDNGVGIPTEKLPRIFDRFYQAENLHSSIGEGTGIGLALVKELVEFMEGKIEASSIPGKETIFSVALPLLANISPIEQADNYPDIFIPQFADESLPTSDEVTEHDNRPSVLIIEDNKDVVSYLKSCLDGIYQVEVAQNGQEGIDKAIEQTPDLIISDVMMPLKDGLEVCDTLKNDERTSHIPIILLTAKADIESRLSGLTRGADDYLTKPFNEKELLIRMKNLLDIRQALHTRYQSGEPIIPTKDISLKKEDEFIIKIREIITTHMSDENFKVGTICQEIGMSRSQLHKKIKALTGNSISHMIKEIRINHGINLLKTTDLQVAEIAFQLGFNDSGYFSRVLVAELGKTPSEIRKEA